MIRSTIREYVRNLLRMVNLKPFTDDMVNDAIEDGIDKLSNRCPFAVAMDRGSIVRNQREYILPLDILEVVEVYYRDEAGTTLDGAILSDDPVDGAALTVLDTTDFDETGTVRIDSEEITYTGKTDTTFTGITRGANDTTAAAHDDGAAVVEPDKAFVGLESRTSRSIATENPSWMSDTGAPTEYYTFAGIIGFDTVPEKSGVFNLAVRSFIRPPALSSDSDDVTSLLYSFVRTIGTWAAHTLAVRLAQDEASQAQAGRWLQDFNTDVALLHKRQDHYERTNKGRIVPVTGRS